MKKFILVTMIAAAAMFSACGDDDDSSSSTSGGGGSVTSCDVTTSMNGTVMSHSCMEASAGEAVKAECSALGGEDVEEEGVKMSYTGKIGSGCPSGYKKTCSGTKGGIAATLYIYDAAAASMSCDVILKGFFGGAE